MKQQQQEQAHRLELEQRNARHQEQLQEQRSRVWSGLSFAGAMSTARKLEASGAVVLAIAVLEGLLSSQCPLSPLESVRGRLILADFYHAYTWHPERVRRRLTEAATILDSLGNSIPSSCKGLVMKTNPFV